MKEIWRDIKDYEGLYQVSNLGNIKSLHRNKIKLLKCGIALFNEWKNTLKMKIYHKLQIKHLSYYT